MKLVGKRALCFRFTLARHPNYLTWRYLQKPDDAYDGILALDSNTNRLGWQGKRVEHLRFGAILHDVGKIFVDETILKKVKPLTDSEWAEIHEHPVRGAELLKDIHYLAPAIPVVRYHHERWNGKGYPNRLAGENIPPEARIVTVADSFDAMTTTRSYHPAWSLEHAVEEIQCGSGTLYDPSVVAAFQKCWAAKDIQRIAGTWGEGQLPVEILNMMATD